MNRRRVQRITKATGLTVSLWDRNGENFLETLAPATWFEDITEQEFGMHSGWHEVEAHAQLATQTTPQLQRLAFTGRPPEYLVTFAHGGRNYAGGVLIINMNGARAIFSVQGGFQQVE